jgi:hypothetical protein
MFGIWGKSAGLCWLSVVAAVTLPRVTATASEFHFDHDTFAFANQTVFEYHEGHASLRRGSAVKKDAYNRHCFVLCRTAMQFKKFARFDPKSSPAFALSHTGRRGENRRQKINESYFRDTRICGR